MVVAPCKGCEERHTSCHSSCSKYLEYKDVHNKEMKEIRKEKDMDNFMYECRSKSVKRALRRSGKK